MRANSFVTRVAATVPPEALFVTGAVSQYLGAALAVLLFAHIPASGVAMLRVGSAALVLMLWRRPGGRRSRREWTLIAVWGIALALMNLTFYLSIDRIPVGTAVAIEFVGPVAVAALGSRRMHDWLALTTAGAGVVLLADVHLSSTTGVVLALIAGVFWAAYIVAGHRVAESGLGVDALALAMLAGAIAIAPFVGPSTASAFHDPALLLAAVGVGVLSSVLPYAIDQITLRRLSRHRFALTLAVLPATAVIVGSVVLGQVPSIVDAAGIALVMASIALTQGTAAAPNEPATVA